MKPENDEIVRRVRRRLEAQRQAAKHQWAQGPIRHFIVDDLLDEATARAAFESFPAADHMLTQSSLGQSKQIVNPVALVSSLPSGIAEAFHDRQIAELIGEIIGWDAPALEADPDSSVLMLLQRGSFLNPHLDASHDAREARYRVLSLFYYLTPDWRLCDGGNLELWHDGVSAPQTTVLAKFNRLVVLAAGKYTWHSVSPVTSRRPRCSISSSYFARSSLSGEEYYHPATFRGRPEQKLLDFVLRAELNARSLLRRRSHPHDAG